MDHCAGTLWSTRPNGEPYMFATPTEMPPTEANRTNCLCPIKTSQWRQDTEVNLLDCFIVDYDVVLIEFQLSHIPLWCTKR